MVSRQVANQISRTTSASIAKNLADRLLIPQLKIRNGSGFIKDWYVSADQRYIALLHEDGSIRIWDTRLGVQRPAITPKNNSFTQIVVLPGKGLLIAAEKNGDLAVYDVLTGRLTHRTGAGAADEAVSSLALSEDESILFVAYDNGAVTLRRTPELQVIKSFKTPYDDEIDFLLPENQGKSLVIAGEGGFVDRWDVGAGTKTAELAHDIDDVVGIWRNPDNQAVMFFDKDGVLQKFEQSNVELGKEFVDDVLAIAANDDLSQVAVASEDKQLRLFTVNGLTLLKSIQLDKEILHLRFVNQSKQLLAVDERGILLLFDVRNGKELLKMISTDSGWTIVDNQGRFDSSEAGMDNVSWETEIKEIELDHFSETHYEPGLLADHLEGGQFINQQPVVVQQGIKLPPEISLIVPDGEKKAAQPLHISVEVQGMGGGIGKVGFYHNGKVLTDDAVVDSREETDGSLKKKILVFRVSPTAGQNRFKVIAANEMGIEGHSEELQIDFAGDTRQPTLHVLTIGVNKYQDPRLNLDYSVADAEAIAAIFDDRRAVAYQQVEQHKLRDGQATKAAILTRLKSLSGVEQQDVFAVYFAGHGIAVDGEWYFLPHETTLQEDLSYYTKVGLSATEIKQALTQAKAQKIFVLVDSCYSGAGLHAFRKLQDSQRHFSRSLSKSVGLVIMAATRQDQEAAELADLGHGLFTYVVSEGLSGQADIKPKNQRISAHEVADYSVQVIPVFSKKYIGASQEPTAFTMGSDFNLLYEKRKE